MKKRVKTHSLLFYSFLVVGILSLNISKADETLIEKDLKEALALYDFEISVDIFNNKQSGLQDLLIKPAGKNKYSTGSFIYGVVNAISDITLKSFAYRLYIGVAMMEINDQLWAISAENCRKALKFGTVEEQNNFLQKNLKRLK